MPILIATDAWHPQVNGVVRTLTSLANSASGLGEEIAFLTPEGFPSMPVPTYPGLRIALPNRREIARRIDAIAPDPANCLAGEEIAACARLAGQSKAVCSLDLVEINPRYDCDGRSARWAAVVLWNFLVGLARR